MPAARRILSGIPGIQLSSHRFILSFGSKPPAVSGHSG
jgi:hypothetical protein